MKKSVMFLVTFNLGCLAFLLSMWAGPTRQTVHRHRHTGRTQECLPTVPLNYPCDDGGGQSGDQSDGGILEFLRNYFGEGIST